MMKKIITTVLVSLILVSISTTTVLAVTPTDVTMKSRLTGKTQEWDLNFPNPNQTHTNYHVWGTDLGIMWDAGNGKVMIAFGDTDGSAGEPYWRSNTLAFSTDTNPEDGLTIDSMVLGPLGRAKQIIPSKKINNDEITVIPTAGITVGTKHYIHYMSVNHWGTDANWITNYSGIAYSDDDGETWTKADMKWMNDIKGNNKFQQAAFIKDDGYVYMFSTENGRAGDVYLSRVPENDLLKKRSYQYWDGSRWVTDKPTVAKPVAKGPAGELSVVYNSYYDKWFMAYKNKHRKALVLREADSLIGPWTGEKILKTGGGLYGPYFHPLFNDGPSLYFNMTRWKPEYNVFFMKADLKEDSLDGNLITDPGFEEQDIVEQIAPWEYDTNNCTYCDNDGAIEIESESDFAYTGNNNAIVSGSNGSHAITQKLVVAPNTNYTLTGWIRSSENIQEGSLGVRIPDGEKVLYETKFNSLSEYTELAVSFSSGDNAVVEVFANMIANEEESWIRIDDLSVIEGGTPDAKPSWSKNKQLKVSNVTSNGLTLKWSGATDDHEVTGYQIYINGEMIDTVNDGKTETYHVNDLVADRSYTFRVEAIDKNNHVSTDGPVYVLGENLVSDPSFEKQTSKGNNLIDDTDRSESLIYYGSWEGLTQSGAYQNTVHVTNQADDELEYSFKGNMIRFFTKTGPASGIIDIYIDDVKKASFDTYSPNPTHQVLAYENLNLAPSEDPHTIKVVHTGKKNAASNGYFVHADYFETSSYAPWYSEGNTGIDIWSDFAYSGSKNAWVSGSSGWHSLYQPINIEPHTSYRLTAWIQTSTNNQDGRLGVRLPQNGTILNEETFSDLSTYTKQTVVFDSGSNSSIEIFAGLMANNGNTWMRLDDISLEVIPDFSSLRTLTKEVVSKKGIQKALQAKLRSAEDSRIRGNIQASNNQLNAFINQVNAQTGKSISREDAITLIWYIRQLMQE